YFFAKEAHFNHNIKITNPEVKNIQLEVFYQACIDMCINQTKYFVFDLEKLTSKEVHNFEELAVNTADNDQRNSTAITENTGDKREQQALHSIFIIVFFSGIAAMLKHAVFTQMPKNVSVLTKQGKSKAQAIRNAVIYGFSYIIMYVVLGVIVTEIFGAD